MTPHQRGACLNMTQIGADRQRSELLNGFGLAEEGLTGLTVRSETEGDEREGTEFAIGREVLVGLEPLQRFDTGGVPVAVHRSLIETLLGEGLLDLHVSFTRRLRLPRRAGLPVTRGCGPIAGGRLCGFRFRC